MNFNCFSVILTGFILSSSQTIAMESVKKDINSQKIILTAKERLGKKYSDDQRTNNCKVSLEKRGSKPRPDKCNHQ